MNAKPHINGNSPESFQDAGWKLHNIAIKSREQINKAIGEITHGRNYQHLTSDAVNVSRSEDLDRIGKIQDALNDLEAIAREIYDIGGAAL